VISYILVNLPCLLPHQDEDVEMDLNFGVGGVGVGPIEGGGPVEDAEDAAQERIEGA